jgi:hypothetical protein
VSTPTFSAAWELGQHAPRSRARTYGVKQGAGVECANQLEIGAGHRARAPAAAWRAGCDGTARVVERARVRADGLDRFARDVPEQAHNRCKERQDLRVGAAQCQV